MRLTKIKVNEYGPLKNISIDLDSGINLIEGKNESGKSSLISFIRFIFYGLPPKRGDDGTAERERALSWSNSVADGAAEINFKGKSYRIERRASVSGTKEAVVDKVKIYDTETGAEVFRGEQPGKIFLGVLESVFDSTACVRQLGIGELDGPGVGTAIENMLFSADAAINAKNAVSKLTAARRSLKNARGDGKLADLERKRDDLKYRLQRAENSSAEIAELMSGVEKYRALSTEVRNSLNRAEDLCSEYEAMQTLRRFDMLHAGERKIDDLKCRQERLEAQNLYNGALPERTLSHLMSSVAELLKKSDKKYSEAYGLLSEIKNGRPKNAELAEFGDAAAAYGDGEMLPISERYKIHFKKLHSFGTASLIAFIFGVLCVGAGAVLTHLDLIPSLILYTAAVFGTTFLVTSLICRLKSNSHLKKAYAYAALLGWVSKVGWKGQNGSDKGKAKKIPDVDDFSSRADACFEASAEHGEYRELIAKLEEDLSQKRADRDYRLEEAIKLLSESGIDATGRPIGDYPDDGNTESISFILYSNSQRINDFYAEHDEILRDIDKYTYSVNETALSLSGADETSLRAKCEKLGSVINAQSNGVVDGRSYTELKKTRDFERARLEKCEMKHIELEKKLIAVEATSENPSKLYPLYEKAVSEAAECQKEFEALSLAAASIEEAGNTLRLGVTPRLRRDAGAILSELTGGKYSSLGIASDLSITVQTDTVTRALTSLSTGTRDVAFFALRLALSGLLYSDSHPPLLLDEALAMMDDDRALGLLEPLCKRTNGNDDAQCLIFSCHSRERRLLESIDARFCLIEL